MVGKLVADQFRIAAVGAGRAGLHQGEPVLVVEDVQGLALHRERAVRAVLAEDLERPEVDPLGFPARRPGRPRGLGHLAGPLAGHVVDVVGGLRPPARTWRAVVCSRSAKSQPQQRYLRHRRRVALLVVAERWAGDGPAGSGAAQPVAWPVRARAGSARCSGKRGSSRRGQGPRNGAAPAAGCRPRRSCTARCSGPSPRRRPAAAGRPGARRSRRAAPAGVRGGLAEVLTSGRLDQPVERVVGVAGGRADHAVAEERRAAAHGR